MLVLRLITRTGKKCCAGKRVGGVETGVVAHDVDEAADEQAGGCKKHDGECDFNDQQAMTEHALFARLADAHGGGLEGGAEIETRAADGRSESEEQRGDKGEPDGEGENPAVNVDGGTELAEG